MATKTTDAPTGSFTLRAVVPIASGTCGWTGKDVPQGETLTTNDRTVYDRLRELGYGISK